jgi:tRNA(fMet)-specific endonuclease VapC
LSVRYLLDTNVLSEPLKAVPDASVLAHLDQHAGAVATASTVWHELLFGVSLLPKGRPRSTAERYLQNVIAPNIPVLGYDTAAASWHAQERARLSLLGRTPPFVDGQIAAIAAVNGLTLVTHNTRDFAEFRELSLASWHSR